jgi:hypothetical protein
VPYLGKDRILEPNTSAATANQNSGWATTSMSTGQSCSENNPQAFDRISGRSILKMAKK